ncbi:hypothetical protein Sme01_47720 [Sphaerisporangium melleum]|uniref:WD40 repeat domain-containing protein n=1 Tax=Sphaerisporangium melleum TaxID=321316 RepID=A0A917VVN7_9ACTN|nr:hypothetical protein [Sphaerisporangium melleum]GGL18904.1 hypothetical protein GCM10007964_71150 [Sphaerisporangium melleum]GII72296.1 hypothetical protein Sme01_47720 [Sphaerisporangium melleum]
MNDTLREDLHALAEQAPTVDLAAQAVRGARRRRAGRLAVVAVTCLLALSGTGLLLQLPPMAPTVLARPQAKALPLPAKGVGAVEQAFRPGCIGGSCTDRTWHIVTRQGDTYRLGKETTGPLEVTADGRRIAYYDVKRGGIVVRDLASGKTWQAPLKQPADDFSVEYALRLSPSGLRFIVSGWGGRREPNKLVDVERGTVTDLKRGWWPVSVSDGSGPVVLAKPYDMTSQVWVLGHDPITIGDFTYSYSALAPDGRTLARLGQTVDRNRRPMVRQDGSLVTFSAIQAGRESRTVISGLPEGLHPSRLGSWLNATEVTVLAVPESPGATTPAVYAVDVRTGKARKLFTVRGDGQSVVPGLVR